MKALLIHHPKAGGRKLSRKEAVALLEQRGLSVEVLPRDRASTKAIARARPDLIVVAGGDGTVAEIVQRLPDRSVPVAFLPSGTANNIARSLGIRSDLEATVEAWDIDRRARLDLGRVRRKGKDRTFVEAVGFGAFAASLHADVQADGMNKLEAGRTVFAEALSKARSLTFGLSIDGKELRLRALLLEVMNVSVTGPWLRLSPQGDAGDGQLDLVFLPAKSRRRMQQWLKAVSESPPPLMHLRGRRIALEVGACAMRVDDEAELLKGPTKISVSLESVPIQILASAEEGALDAPLARAS